MELVEERRANVTPVLANRQDSLSVRDVEKLMSNKEQISKMPFLPKGGEVYVFHATNDRENRDWVADGHR